MRVILFILLFIVVKMSIPLTAFHAFEEKSHAQFLTQEDKEQGLQGKKDHKGMICLSHFIFRMKLM